MIRSSRSYHSAPIILPNSAESQLRHRLWFLTCTSANDVALSARSPIRSSRSPKNSVREQQLLRRRIRGRSSPTRQGSLKNRLHHCNQNLHERTDGGKPQIVPRSQGSPRNRHPHRSRGHPRQHLGHPTRVAGSNRAICIEVRCLCVSA